MKRKIKLSNSVGNNLANNETDIIELKNAIAFIKDIQLDSNFNQPHGFITRELDETLRSYQTEKSLKSDGLVFPDGETHQAINEDLFLLSDENNTPNAAPVAPVEREELMPDNIPGTNIPDQSLPESYYPSDIPKTESPYEKGVPMPPVNVPNPNIDPDAEIPYDPWKRAPKDRWV